MHPLVSLDLQVRARLLCWPQRPPGVIPARRDLNWIRGRPGERSDHDQPFLKLPGSTHLRTMPDGLWLGFGGSPAEAYVDVIAIEACGTIANLLDKRSRFAPSTQSLMAVCPPRWLRGPKDHRENEARWQLTRIRRAAPEEPLILPVRDMRVVYALKPRLYNALQTTHTPQPHEFFVPIEALVAEGSHENPEMRALFARASASSNFLAALSAGP
jgi:hypothetical protein